MSSHPAGSVVRLNNSTISGLNLKVYGDGNRISGMSNEVHGQRNVVSGMNARVFGTFNTVSGMSATVHGDQNVVSGMSATVHGNHNVISGMGSNVRGDNNRVSGMSSSVEGINNDITGFNPTTNSTVHINMGSSDQVTGMSSDEFNDIISVFQHPLFSSNAQTNQHVFVNNQTNIPSSNHNININRSTQPRTSVRSAAAQSTAMIRCCVTGSDMRADENDSACCICLERKSVVMSTCCRRLTTCITCAKNMYDGKQVGEIHCPNCRGQVTEVFSVLF